MARESRGAVVFMHSAPGHNGGSGVGFVFDPQGYILANAHVVDDIPKIEVVLIDGRRLRAHVVGMVEDKNPDVAVLRVEADSPLPALTFGDPPDSGDTVLAIGHPAMTAFWVPIAGTVVRVERQSVRVDMLSFFGMGEAPLLDRQGRVAGLIFGTKVPRVDRPTATRLELVQTWEQFGRLKPPVSAVSVDALKKAVALILEAER